MRNFEVSARNTATQTPAASDTQQAQPCIFEAPQKCIQHSRDSVSETPTLRTAESITVALPLAPLKAPLNAHSWSCLVLLSTHLKMPTHVSAVSSF